MVPAEFNSANQFLEPEQEKQIKKIDGAVQSSLLLSDCSVLSHRPR